MSTNQIFLTKQSAKKVTTETKVAISSEQSQKLIQTMLTMSFGCLSFLRGLFPDEYFLDQRFIPEKKDKQQDSTDKQNNSIKIKTLIKGKSKEIDLLLNWLEKGVFQSIKLKYLKALSLGIFIDENNPRDLFENYIFTFDYNDNDDVSMSIDTQKLSEQRSVGKSTNNDIITIKDSRKMVQQLMRRFIIITQSLEPLPDEKFLSMRLVFNDNVDPKYQPSLFKDSTFEPRATIKIPRNNSNGTFDVGKLNTGHHQCSLAVLSTCQNLNKNQEDIEMEDYQEIDPLQHIIDIDLQEMENNQVETTASLLIENETNMSQQPAMVQQSQTANILGEYLNSSQPSILPTQIEASFNHVQKKVFNQGQTLSCECNTSLENAFGSIKLCFICNRKVHGLCYGNTKNSNVKCFTCVYQSEGKNKLNTNTPTFHKFMILRKTYRAINKLFGDPPEDLLQYLSRVFTKDECKIAKNIEDFIFALNCLFYDNTFHITLGNEVASKFAIFCELIVNISGVKTKEQIPLNMGNKYPITIQIGNRTGNLSYLKVLPQSKEEIEQWISDFERLQNILANCETKVECDMDYQMNGKNIAALSSLTLGDTETQDPIQIGKKRKGLDLEEYLDTKDSSRVPITCAINSGEDLSGCKNKRKVRKISVSKGIVKSSW